MDPSKLSAQSAAQQTANNMKAFGFSEISASRGESAYVWDQGDSYGAFVIEGLGTKSLIADAVRKFSGRTHYGQLAQDTIAMIVNDLVVVGAMPVVVNAYWAVGDSSWHDDHQRVSDLISGWQTACDAVGATWGGGETPTLKDITIDGVIDLAGSAYGIIKQKTQLVLGDTLSPGDHIVLIESSGVHANGITLTRKIADNLPDGYATKLADGSTYGETLLNPTHLYVPLVRELQNQNIPLHYLANITGHGWRKLMRASQPYTYRLHTLPPVPEIFRFIAQHSKSTDEDMYGNYNMGAGFAVYTPGNSALEVIEIAKNLGFTAWDAGIVESGPRQVILEPIGLTFNGDSLGVRA